MDRRLANYRARLDKKLKITRKKDHVRIKIADTLCIYSQEDRDYTLNVMKNISGFAVNERIPVHLDLRSCKEITLGAMVMLFAEISRARLATGFNEIIKILYPSEDTELREMLSGVGWEKATNTPYQQLDNLVEQNEYFQSNNNPNLATQAVYKLLTSQGLELDLPEVKMFTRGVTEAMLNVINHAYEHEADATNGIGRRWWQACYVGNDTENNQKTMLFIIYDLGQGVLKSLPKEDNESYTEHIERAMSYGVTRTGDPKRGKGFEDIKNAAYIRRKSTLLVGTNNVFYMKWRNRTHAEECKMPFFGTVVQWQINLEG